MTPDQLTQAGGVECAAPASQKLNDAQQAAVEAREPFVIVPAGPGAGKTATLVARIRSLLADGVNPLDILTITFTQAGAAEMAKRLDGIRLGFVGTLHGYCFRLLQRHGERIGFRSGISLITEEVAEEVFRETVSSLGWKGSLKDARESEDRKADLVRRAYRDALKRSNLCDYDSVLTEGLALLWKQPQAPKDLLVDEVQDSSVIDWEIYGAIKADRKFMVGDLDQTCYQFRGAAPHLMLERCRGKAVVVPLEQNYRSDVLICEAANRLIVNNPDRIPKWVLPNTEVLGCVKKIGFPGHMEEIRAVAGWVLERITTGTPANEIAVLLRTNALVDQFHASLGAFGIPLLRPESVPLPNDWGRALDMLGVWMNPGANILAKRLLKNHPKWPVILKGSIASGTEIAEAARLCGLFMVPKNLAEVPVMLAKNGLDRGTVELIADRIQQLPQKDADLSDLVADLFTLHRQPDKPDTQGVFVGTIHSSKGREYDAVALPAFEDGIIPSLSKTSTVEAERNLAFVGVTRARHHLWISWAQTRDLQFKRGVQYPVSRFVAEMDLEAWSAKQRGRLAGRTGTPENGVADPASTL